MIRIEKEIRRNREDVILVMAATFTAMPWFYLLMYLLLVPILPRTITPPPQELFPTVLNIINALVSFLLAILAIAIWIRYLFTKISIVWETPEKL